MKLLLIENDVTLAAYVAKGLRESGHVVDVCHSGVDGLYAAAERAHDLVILDRMLPGTDGMTILQTLRAARNDVPVLVISALGEVDDRVEGLHKGADDYLAKPFSLVELLARVEVLGRRRGRALEASHLTAGPVALDLIGRSVTIAGRPVALTAREFKLLEMLVRNAGRVVTRTMLLEGVWDYRFDPQTNIVDQHVSRLRQKIEAAGGPTVIETVRGHGYRVSA